MITGCMKKIFKNADGKKLIASIEAYLSGNEGLRSERPSATTHTGTGAWHMAMRFFCGPFPENN